MPHGVSTLDNKPIIITFLAMEKVILLCTNKTHGRQFGSMQSEKIFKICGKNPAKWVKAVSSRAI